MIFHREEATLTAPERKSHEKKDCGCSRGVAEAQGHMEHSEAPRQCPQQQRLRASDMVFCVV